MICKRVSSVVANLKNVTTEYPTKSEINQLNIDYEKRNEEIKRMIPNRRVTNFF